MTNPFKFRSDAAPILAPLARGSVWRRARARFERLPPAVAPVVVTLIGGLGIVLLFGALVGGEVPKQDARQTATIGNEVAVPEANAAAMAGGDTGAETATAEPVATPAAELQSSAEAKPVESPPLLSDKQAAADNGMTAPSMTDGSQPVVVAVAESADEIFALEEIQRREVEADVGPPSNETTAAIRPASGPKVAATATKWVNMRAGPSDDAEILTVVPALAEIEAESDCRWCAVSYDGRQGYIFKTFISYE